MNKKKFIKIAFLFMVFIFVIFIKKDVFAMTNQNYATTGISVNYSDGGVVSKILGFIQSAILSLLAYAIFGLTWVVEVLVAGVNGLLTGNLAFPWADRTIFNGMPLLDVNFINPSSGSLFMDNNGSFTNIGNAVRNIYFTGLSIALGFLGIIVAIMAIRLAISSIASEKAKYKEAIVHWVTALVLLFGMHFVISFVFYLNEQLVEVASGIAFKTMQDNQANLSFFNQTGNVSSFELMGDYFKNNAIDLMSNFGINQFTYALLYAIFVVQSVMFFWSYAKRFFYIMILSMISPFVVVYDFLTKSVS